MKIRMIILTSLLVSLIFSIALAFLEYTPISERQDEIAYFSFGSLIIIYLNYTLPIFLLLGLIIKLVVKIIKK
jgi:hypothetical protein